MKNNIELIYDTKPNQGCGCNCGCAGTSIVEEVNDLVENLKSYEFNQEPNIELLAISDLEEEILITKLNALLENTNATFRVTKENKENILSELLPIVTFDDRIITAYGVPTLYEVVQGIEQNQ